MNEPPTTIIVSRIWDGEALRDADAIRIENGRIAAVGDAGELGRNAVLVRCPGATALPGLIDAHVHLELNPDNHRPPESTSPDEVPRMLERAAARGNARARTRLGQKYADGCGVKADPVVGYMYLLLGASLGDTTGAETMAELERTLTAAQIDEARRLARNWRPW